MHWNSQTSRKSPSPEVTFSVVIPVLNRIAFIKRCFESLWQQNITDFECIIVDNGSSDGTYEYCSGLLAEHPQLTLLRVHEKGVAFARNEGIKQASGCYVILLDSDNTLAASDTLSCLSKAIKETGYRTAYFCGVVFDNGRISSPEIPDRSRFTLYDYLTHSAGELAPVVSTAWLKAHLFPEKQGIIAEQADMLWIPLLHEMEVTALSLPVIGYYADAPGRVSQRDYQRHNTFEMAEYYQNLVANYGATVRLNAGTFCYLRLILKMCIYSRLGKIPPRNDLPAYLKMIMKLTYYLPASLLRLPVSAAKKIKTH